MNADAEAKARLVDIVVEEVSLVDRAANKRRFLVVKRDPEGGPMAGEQAGGDEGRASGEVGTERDASLPDAAALAAVEGLCEATLALSEHAQSEADIARVVALAGEVESLALAVTTPATQAGAGEPAATGETPAVDAEPSAAGAPAADTSAASPEGGGASDTAQATEVGKALSDAEELVARVRQSVAKPQPAAVSAPQAASTSSAATPPVAAPSSPTGALQAALQPVLDAVGTLTKAVQAQGERLGRLEKGVGAPASQPANEHPREPDDDHVSWPIDLNLRVDRAGVDKSVSFHDL